MANELATASTQSYLALRDGGGVALALAENLGEESSLSEGDLTRVTIPAEGRTTWIIPGLGGDEETKAIEGILAYQCRRGVLWGSDDPTPGTLPVLRSDDLRVAKLQVPESYVDRAMLASIAPAKRSDGLYDWDKLPQAEWGSGKKGIGKAAKEQWVLFVLRPDDALPLVLNIQPGSVKAWREFLVGLAKAGIPYYEAVIKLTLAPETSKGGVKYSQVVPTLVARLSKEEGQGVKQMFGSTLAAVARKIVAE